MNLAAALDCRTAAPGALIEAYAQALEWQDTELVRRVDDCIVGDQVWRRWAQELVERGKGFPFTPRVIAVTPPASGLIINGLAAMMREGEVHETRRDTRTD